MGHSFYHLDSLPQQYDVVWCLYPHRENRLAPGPVARPVLVLDVRADPERKIGALVVAYGTGEFHSRHEGMDLIIDDRAEYEALGLHKPTRFAVALDQRMCLPWCVEYFVPQAYVRSAGIRAGSLNDKQIERLLECFDARGLKPYC